VTSKTPYYKAFDALKNIYLEDSWVLEIHDIEKSISFEMEFVLTKSHKFYDKPKKGEQYCYKRGQLILSGCAAKTLHLSDAEPSIDANGEKDLGNIYLFVKQNEQVELEGEWGRVIAKCDEVLVRYSPDEVSS
jgi:hypothetical protein